MKQKRTSPCHDCPFRRNSMRGWLGNNTPKPFIAATIAEHDMPCHIDEWQEDNDSRCAGSVIFLNNWMQLPKFNQELLVACQELGTSSNVFSTPWGFVIHHRGEQEQYPYDYILGNKERSIEREKEAQTPQAKKSTRA